MSEENVEVLGGPPQTRPPRPDYIFLRAWRASPTWTAISAKTTPVSTQLLGLVTNWRIISAKISAVRASSHPRHGCGYPL